MEVSKACIEDLSSLVEMGRAFFYEAKWDNLYKWDDDSARPVLEDFITNESAVVYVARKDDTIIGMACALLYPLWYNNAEIVAQELFLYVKPEHRRGVGHKLALKLEESAKEKGARAMVMGSVEAMPSLEEYYRKCSYSPSERTYIKGL